MNLLVDLGNSRLKWAVAQTSSWRGGGFAFSARFADDLDRAWLSLPRPQRVVAASVGDAEHARDLADWVQNSWGLSVEFVEARLSGFGVTNRYDEPTRLGADRWAALIAAHHLWSGAVCIVDCGTAVTVDALSADGVFQGGVILPGIALMRGSLRSGTAGIRHVDGLQSTCFAHNTADAVAAGTLFGLAGAVERIAQEFRPVLGENMRLVITGGAAVPLATVLGARLGPLIHEPDLVLRGLAFIVEHGA